MMAINHQQFNQREASDPVMARNGLHAALPF